MYVTAKLVELMIGAQTRYTYMSGSWYKSGKNT